MLVGSRDFYILSVPSHIVVPVLHSVIIGTSECIDEVLTDIQAWNDAFEIHVQRIPLIKPEIRSETDIRIEHISCRLHLLQGLATALMEGSVKGGIHDVVFIPGVVVETV